MALFILMALKLATETLSSLHMQCCYALVFSPVCRSAILVVLIPVSAPSLTDYSFYVIVLGFVLSSILQLSSVRNCLPVGMWVGLLSLTCGDVGGLLSLTCGDVGGLLSLTCGDVGGAIVSYLWGCGWGYRLLPVGMWVGLLSLTCGVGGRAIVSYLWGCGWGYCLLPVGLTASYHVYSLCCCSLLCCLFVWIMREDSGLPSLQCLLGPPAEQDALLQ